jgi:hypothetical protein
MRPLIRNRASGSALDINRMRPFIRYRAPGSALDVNRMYPFTARFTPLHRPRSQSKCRSPVNRDLGASGYADQALRSVTLKSKNP